jgi:hypothetical protein
MHRPHVLRIDGKSTQSEAHAVRRDRINAMCVANPDSSSPEDQQVDMTQTLEAEVKRNLEKYAF